MAFRKFLLSALFTMISLAGLVAQDVINVHGTVTNVNGEPQDSVNILVSALFSDSSGFFVSLYTNSDGTYEVEFDAPDPNVFGTVEVTMVDCSGITQTQVFTVANGASDFQADFVFCETINTDSCVVIILEEWNPGNNYVQLNAWTPPGFGASYLWSTGETSQTIIPQSSGNYCVTVSLPFGCTATDCIEISLDSMGNCFTYIISELNNDGSYDLQAVASGNPPFDYLWNNGVSGAYLNGVGPGTYCVTSTDASGCTYTSCIIIDDFDFCEVYIYEDPMVGGLVAYGYGQEPSVYVWSTGDTSEVIYPNAPGVYCVTMTDANGCTASSCYDYGNFQDSCYVYVNAFMQDSNILALQAVGYTSAESWAFLWNTGETTEIIYPQDPNQAYCVTMTDSDGCVSSACFETGFWCYAWIDLQYVDTTTAVLTVFSDPIFNWPGSNTPTYVWSTGDTSQSLTVTESGEYCVTVTIGNNCITEACVYVDFENLGNDCYVWINQYPDSSGQWLAEAWAWGWGTFEYLWSNGDTNAVTIMNSPDEYLCVTVTSSFGCETVACVDTFFQPCQPWISVDYANNNTAVLTAYGFNDPNSGATYLWNTGESGPVITVSVEGTYCVTVASAGCTGEACVDVYFWNVDSCGVWISADDSNGAGIEYTANAWGTAPFTYLWSNGSTEPSVFIDFGIHDLCVTITDANGCVSSGCNYPVDSCYIELVYSNNPPSIYAVTLDPLALVYWNTGDTSSYIEISEPGTYCATVTTIFGCVTTACMTIDTIIPGEGQNGVGGFVYADSTTILSGTVIAYVLDPNTGQAFMAADSAQIGVDGYYYIPGLPDGIYLIKAILNPGSPGAVQYLPTYHLSATKWDEATKHVLPNWLPVTTDIWMVRTTGMNGGGVIGGVVIDPQHIIADESVDPRDLIGLANIEILLSNAQGQPLNYTWSLEDGSYRFINLPWGTYRINFDIPGLVSPDVWVTLTPEYPERLQVNLIAEGAVAVEEPTTTEVILFPNPAKEEINIPLPGNATYDVWMTDMQGKIVYTGSARNTNGVMRIGVSSYAPGLYFVNLKGESGLYHGRFIKQE